MYVDDEGDAGSDFGGEFQHGGCQRKLEARRGRSGLHADRQVAPRCVVPNLSCSRGQLVDQIDKAPYGGFGFGGLGGELQVRKVSVLERHAGQSKSAGLEGLHQLGQVLRGSQFEVDVDEVGSGSVVHAETTGVDHDRCAAASACGTGQHYLRTRACRLAVQRRDRKHQAPDVRGARGEESGDVALGEEVLRLAKKGDVG
jgi:hypothetical protein